MNLPPPSTPPAGADAAAALALLQRRFERERTSRKAAEALLNEKSRALYDSAQAAREAERRLQLALWASGEGIWSWDVPTDSFSVDGLDVMGQTLRLGPCPMAELQDMVEPIDRDSVRLAFGLYLNQAAADIDTAFRGRLNGAQRWLRIRGRALTRDDAGRPTHVTGTIKDVTEQRAAEQSLHMMAQAFGSTHDALVIIDASDTIVQANAPFAMLLERPLVELEGGNLATVLGLEAPLATRGTWRGDIGLGEGYQLRHIEVAVTPVSAVAHGGGAACSIVALRDVSERRRAEDALHRQAYVDGLTGLVNRLSVMRLLDERCGGGSSRLFALLYIDLDGFKAVNDTLGHHAGDALLRDVSRRLRHVASAGCIGRLGGDEFVVVLPTGTDADEAAEFADLVIQSVSRPYRIDGQVVVVTPSIGIAVHPQHGGTPEDLLLNADIAMYAAKQLGRRRFVTFHADLDSGRQRRQHLQQLLRTDSDRDAFTFVAQSQFDATGRPIGGELLIRWQTAAFGAVSPAEFIPLAEQIGVIDRIGRQAMRTAAQVASIAQFMGLDTTLAVNLSPRQLLQDDVEAALLEACELARVPPARLCVELTESALVTDAQRVGDLLRRLAERGFVLALDDFGTGYSSLSHLRELPFHKVKVDRSFVRDLGGDPRARVMLDGIVKLCTSLGLAVVAEGVETRAQFEQLVGMGVTQFQGYWFARPQPLATWIESVAQGQVPADTLMSASAARVAA